MYRARLLAAVLAVAMVTVPVTAAEYHVVNGTPAQAGAYPWFATVQIDFGDGQGPVHWCGGSLVDAEWVLSAAHCYTDQRSGEQSFPTESMSVVLDTAEWADPGQGERLDVVEVVLHPDYDPITQRADMVLLRLAAPTDIDPIRMAGPQDAALEAPPTTARVIGFGDTAFGANQPSDVLLEADVPVVSDEECNASGDYIEPAVNICAGRGSGDPDNPNPDSCQGDSGGPLFVPEEPVLLGVTSYGTDCGITDPGVYAQVTTFRGWLDGVIAGEIEPGDPDPGGMDDLPDGAEVDPIRIRAGDGDDPVANAIAVSQFTYGDGAQFAVLAASSRFPDALGGSALAGYLGPLLYVDAQGQLPDDVRREIMRVVPPGGVVYLLGGEAVIPGEVQATLEDDGFIVVRLAGAGRQQTAAIVADEVVDALHGGVTPFNAVIVAFEGNWPDAVAVGQISAWFGIPVLLTPRDVLGEPAADYLRDRQPSNVLVLGGDAVIGQAVRQQIADITSPEALVELAGTTRIETSALMARLAREELHPVDVFGIGVDAPATVVVVNLRRDDAFAHVLAASPLVGTYAGLFAPVDGDGTSVEQVVLDSVCGTDAQVLVMGSPDLVSDQAAFAVQQAALGEGCTP